MSSDALSEPVTEQGIAEVIPFESPKPQSQPEEEKDQRIRDLKSQIRLAIQTAQALSDLNRWYASEKLGRPATDNEAFLHFVFHGGKSKFDETHPC